MTKDTVAVRHSFYLFLTAFIWGSAFVAQSVGNVMGPFTFNSIRNFLACFVLLPFIRIFYGNLKVNRVTLRGGICCGVCLFLASNVQQLGLVYTSPGKAGFITACYMVIVPIVGAFLGQRIPRRVWIAVVMALFGLYFLCIPKGESFQSVNLGDLLCLLCACLFTLHILCIDHFTQMAEGVKMSCIQFFVCAVLSFVLMLFTEQPSLAGIREGAAALLYAGIMSSGVAYSLQIVGQKGVHPAVASLILSLESCFSVLTGWMILGSKLNGRELFGCAVMFAAIILTQLPERAGKGKKA